MPLNKDNLKLHYAALYIRVSTDAQREEGYSIEAQKLMLEGYCKSKNIENYEYYIDGGFSGSNIERPAMTRLIEDIKRGVVSAVIVYKLDRLSRSQKDTLYLIEDVLNPGGVSFVSINENMDTATPIGRAMLGIMSAFAQLERETIRERTRMGMHERVKSGLWRGGGKVPFGYDYDRESGKLVKNADSQTVALMYSLYLKGYSTLSIARITGLKYERLALQILKRLSNTGCTVYNSEIIENTHEPIISREIYDKVQAEMKRRSKGGTGVAKCLLAGLIYCGVCGHKMRYQKWSSGKYKIYCYSQDSSKTHIGGDKRCDNKRIDADVLEREVLSDLFSLKPEGNPDDIDTGNTLATLESAKAGLLRRLERLYVLYSSASDDTLTEVIENVKKELADIHDRIGEVKNSEKREAVITDEYKKLGEVETAWNTMSLQERRCVLCEMIDRIVVTYDRVDIYYSDKIRLNKKTELIPQAHGEARPEDK